MKNFKIYSTNKKVVQEFANDLGKPLEFLREGEGAGYCEGDTAIRVFVQNSHVDMSDDFDDITDQYVDNYSAFTL